jgi:hypothetical protein
LQAFGIKGDLLGLIPGRQTFVFDKQGSCVLSFNSQMNAEQHVVEAVQAIHLVLIHNLLHLQQQLVVVVVVKVLLLLQTLMVLMVAQVVVAV